MLRHVLDQVTRNQERRRRDSLRTSAGARHSGSLECEADLRAHRPAQKAARPELSATTPTHSSSGTVLDVHHESPAGPVEVVPHRGSSPEIIDRSLTLGREMERAQTRETASGRALPHSNWPCECRRVPSRTPSAHRDGHTVATSRSGPHLTKLGCLKPSSSRRQHRRSARRRASISDRAIAAISHRGETAAPAHVRRATTSA